MSEDEVRRLALAAHSAMDGIGPFLDMLDGFAANTRRRGFTDDQSRAIVAYMFGYRPADGSTPDGAGT